MEDEEHQLLHVGPLILLEVGTCPMVLRRPGSDADKNPILTHEVPKHGSIVSHEAGIIEPVTLSILGFLSSEEDEPEEWVEEAVRRNSLPLLARIDIALRQLSKVANAKRAQFALRMRKDLIRPATSALLR
jgi:hypothetical protein